MLGGFLLIVSQAVMNAQVQPPIPAPDSRFKADILVVVAHPDDDTAVSTYLAKAVLDEGKRVAVIFTNRGNSGPNAVGMEQSKALADIREMEARRSLAARGINNVWFLHGQDTPTQDVLHSLETLGHGEALDEVIRLVRLTRPEVIITWLAAYVAGENHGDHQAAGVVAVEAFDLAANPVVFPEQLTPPRYNRGVANYGEGLHPWQAEKLYFFSDASHPDFLKGHGPTYLASEMSRTQKVPYSEINRKAWEQYATQIDFDQATLRYFTDMPEYLVLGKSLVPAPVDADVWAGVVDKPLAFVPKPQVQEQPRSGISLTLGDPWNFYSEFYRAHGLASLHSIVPPQTALSYNRELWIPLLLRNDSFAAADVVIHPDVPAGWNGDLKDRTYHLEPGAIYPIDVYMTAPDLSSNHPPELLEWTARSNGAEVSSARLSVYFEFDGVSQ
jgi:LmbE family N-acetylglucosaminyl deacetylase